MITPREIIQKQIERIPGVRLPLARQVVENIFRALEKEGYTISEDRGENHEARIGNGRPGII